MHRTEPEAPSFLPTFQRRSVRLVLTAIVALLAVWYLYRHGRQFLLLRRFDPLYAPLLLLVPLAMTAINGRILRFLVERFGIHLRWVEWFGLTLLHSFGNYLPIPQVGAAMRALYLKRVHELRYRRFLSILAFTYFGFLVVDGALGLALAALAWWRGGIVPWPLWVAFAALLSVGLAFVPRFWRHPRIVRLEWIREPASELLRGPVILRVFGYQALLVAVHAVGLWIAFASVGRSPPLIAVALIVVAIMASGVANVTPGNLGVAETVGWLSADLVGVDPHETVVAYTIFRIAVAAPIFLLTPWFTSKLLERPP